ncbi:MAG: SdrD B-like domain-containing protein, partial [Paracoccaceae bacterium]
MFDEETGVYTVQAEDMDQHGFRTVSGNQAAGGELVKLTGNDGKLSTEFGAESGVYDLTISAQDESDGVSTLQVFVNGELQGTIKLDQDDDGRGSDNGGFSDFTLDGLNISEGDNVEVRAWKDNGEFVRIDQLEFAQVEQQAEPTPTTVVIQAEDLELNGFKVVSGENAEGGELVRLTGGDGRLSTDFSGVSGTYDLTISAQDESDGVSRIDVYVGGELQGTIYLDQQNNGGGSNNGNFSDFTIEGLEIENGEQVEIRAWRNDGELVRIDQLTFEPVDAAPEPDGLVCIDFEGLTAGAVVSNQFDGVTISAQRDGDGGINSASPNDAMIFDGANPTGGDTDLTASGDNVLIISEDNDSSDPDDNAGGGTIWFEFDTPSFVSSINVLDAEEGGRIRLFDENDQLIQEITIPGGVDGGIQTIDIDVDDVAQIDLTLNGSGAIDDLKFVPGDMPELASVAGTVFMDNNDNSVQDAGDMAQAGVEVILFQSGVGEIARTTTDANGNYLFENVTPGEGFRVQFDNVDGKDFVEANVGGDDTIDSDAIVNPGGASTDRFDLAAGENKTDLDAGVELIDTGDASLAGVVFMDNNDNDIEDASDMRLSGVEVTLLDGEGNTVGTATTDANGAYEFLGLDAGDYTVQFPTNVDGKSLVGQDVGGDDTVDSDADQGSGLSQTVSLGIGERIEDIDAGVEDPGTASLAGRVFMDNNNNSIDDAGDMGVAGVGINLLDAATGAVVAQTNADADGNYIFENLDAGEYVVEFGTLFTGKVNVDANVGGDDTVDSDVVTGVGEVARGRTEPITVNIGDAITDVDNGLEDLGSLSGRFFLDTNRDGQDNDGANGIASVTVELLDEDGNGTGITTTTDADGNYSFGDLLPGEYGVKFTDTVSGRDLTAQNVGNDATDSDAADIGGGMSTIEGITVNAGQDTPDNDAGVLEELGSLSGRFFMDTDNDDSDNNNGDEPAIEGVLVMLLDASGNPTGDQVFTDADGNYSFGDLEPGEY